MNGIRYFPEGVARFEAERQALALMDHRNIAKVVDAGADGTGRPYSAMEYVKGKPITEYSDVPHTEDPQEIDDRVFVARASK